MLKQQKFIESESPLREAFELGEKQLPDHWTTFHAKSLLGGSLLGQSKYDQAEPLLVDGYEGMKQREAKIPPIERSYLLEALDRLIDFYDATAKPDDAAKWRKAREAANLDASSADD
jgi:hypothetical protein